MLADELRAITHLRNLAASGGTPEFYDLLLGRLRMLAAEWATREFTEDERATLTLERHRVREILLRARAKARGDAVGQ